MKPGHVYDISLSLHTIAKINPLAALAVAKSRHIPLDSKTAALPTQESAFVSVRRLGFKYQGDAYEAVSILTGDIHSSKRVTAEQVELLRERIADLAKPKQLTDGWRPALTN